MLETLKIFLAAAFTVAVAMAAGRLLLARSGLPSRTPGYTLLCFACGAPVLSLAVFLLCVARLARWEVFACLGVATLAYNFLSFNLMPHENKLTLSFCARNILFLLIVVPFSVVYLIWALAPELSPDGSAYHLGLIARYAREAGFSSPPQSIYAYLSQGFEMLFLFAYAFGRHSSAALMHLACLFALPLLMIGYGRRFGFPVPATWGALLFFVSPVVGVDGASAYNDVALGFFLFALYYFVEILIEDRYDSLLILIGLLAGFCFAVKYTGFVALPFALVAITVGLRGEQRRFLRSMAMVCGVAALMIAPWLIKNAVTVGNPVAPFFNSWFPNDRVTTEFEESYKKRLATYSLTDRSRIPIEATVKGRVLEGFTGPVFLLLPLALLSFRHPRGRRLLAAGIVFSLPYAANIGTRFLIPGLPFFSLALALALGRSGRLAGVLAAMHAVLSWPPNTTWYADEGAWRIARVPLRAALRLESESDYLNFRLPGYSAARMLEELVPPHARVFAISAVAEAYTSREVLIGYQSARGNTMQQILWSPLADHYKPTGRIRFRFPRAGLSGIRVIQTGLGQQDWGINELRFYDGAKELERAPYWRLRASPNPWDVQMAFDNAAVTPWRARQRTYPGMFVEADFGRVEPLDSALIECACDAENVPLKLEGRDEAGRWRLLNASPERWRVELPPGIRRQATREIKAMGADYLLINDFDYYAEDFRQLASVWGLRLAGERKGARLYFIE